MFCCAGDLYFDNKGMFSIEEKINGTQIKFQLYPNATISWIKGAPPIDSPECGFENEKCVEEVTPKLSKSNRHSKAANRTNITDILSFASRNQVRSS